MKANFTILGQLVDEQDRGIEGSVTIFGYEDQGYVNTKENGNFVLIVNKCSFLDLIFKKYLSVAIKTGERRYQGKISYPFSIRNNKHLKLKIYPFSNRVVEIK